MEGNVYYFDRERQYGFIAINDERYQMICDFFFHVSEVLDPEIEIHPGQSVEFWIDDDLARAGLWKCVDIRRKLTSAAAPACEIA